MSGRVARLRVDDLAAGGDGVGRLDGKACFVPLSAPGDVLDVRIVSETGRMARAEILSIVQPGPARCDPGCALAGRCGGCDWQHVRPEVQSDARRSILARATRRDDIDLARAPSVAGYRRVARMHAEPMAGGSVVMGFFARKRDTLVDVPSCPVLHPAAAAGLPSLRRLLVSRLAGLAEVHLAAGASGVIAAVETPGPLPRAFYDEAGTLPEPLAGIVVVTGGVRAVVAGQGDAIVLGGDGNPLSAPVPGFCQANEAMNLELGRTVESWARDLDARRVLELFAGAGNLSVALGRAAGRVIAVERSGEACRAARRNLADRSLRNVEVRQGDALEAFRAMASSADVVVLDPPRGGHRDLAVELARSRARAAIYVSCDPATLSRDLDELARGGFRATRVRGFEMFPQTAHVEAAVLLER